MQQLKQNGAEVEIEELDSVDIESTHSYRRPEYAQPDGSSSLSRGLLPSEKHNPQEDCDVYPED
ncbi:MAG: hypothetical protein R2734_01565 [Nocardioides sp.]